MFYWAYDTAISGSITDILAFLGFGFLTGRASESIGEWRMGEGCPTPKIAWNT